MDMFARGRSGALLCVLCTTHHRVSLRAASGRDACSISAGALCGRCRVGSLTLDTGIWLTLVKNRTPN